MLNLISVYMCECVVLCVLLFYEIVIVYVLVFQVVYVPVKEYDKFQLGVSWPFYCF